jgi:hypothetical protein
MFQDFCDNSKKRKFEKLKSRLASMTTRDRLRVSVRGHRCPPD